MIHNKVKYNTFTGCFARNSCLAFQTLVNEGIEQGAKAERMRAIRTMSKKGKSVEDIMDFTDYTKEEIERPP